MSKFINTELKSNSDSESSDSDLKPSDSDLKSSDSGSGNFSYSVFRQLQLYLEMHFLRKQFKYTFMVWLLISLAVALYLHGY